jgi:putative ABC transport system substrate-binding protein
MSPPLRYPLFWTVVTLAACLGGVLAGAEEQQVRHVYHIGILNEAQGAHNPTVEGLKAGLAELGLKEGRDVTFDIRITKGETEATRTEAATLVTEGVDLLFTSHEGPTQIAKGSTQKVPIIFTLVGDPVAANLLAGTLWEANKLSHPGGNVTGISSLSSELVPKRLEALKRLVPTIQRVWAIYYAGDASALAAMQKGEESAPRLSLRFVPKPVFDSKEAAQILQGLKPGDALLSPDSDVLGIPAMILEASLATRIPAVFPTADWVGRGGLVSYGPDYYAQGVQAARLVAKVLRGVRTQDLPVESADRIDLAVNLKTAASLGVKVPPTVLLRADRVER